MLLLIYFLPLLIDLLIKMKKILILGSTGSIGKNALELIRNFNDEFSIAGLTVNDNINLLEEQIREFNPSTVVVKNKEKAK